MLANKCQENVGLFMIRFNEQDTDDFSFFIKWKTKLDIDNANLFILRDEEKKYKELVICYKTIFINTFSLQIVDIS